MALGLMVAAGCHSYNREWKAAGERVFTDPFEGRWEGSWRSDRNGHSGRLRCIISKETNTVYQANFQAKYAKTLNFRSVARLETSQEETRTSFGGEAQLP